ncbi:phosphoglucomutase [Encephalitozoon romaleae SJ-2008]|uniref:Phosphoglucomutase n=1 Tax=Encephalitozoon romaleae (strain SJ-2008) TaxID=1178016 RepID=I7ALX1_ENCRO|nr:phosphoglucomutase [Encephalitozoon romaleae SJ-2008]AFN82644.1 phosphoglucomutase [Encephalitozoon romaleae SJ-2008]
MGSMEDSQKRETNKPNTSEIDENDCGEAEELESMKKKYMEATCDLDRFHEDLRIYGEKSLLRLMKFGTGGMRGPMRSGFNGINEVTCNLIGTELCKRFSSIVIGCDGRYNSLNYAILLREIFRLNGKKADLYPEVVTPFLAFLTCKLGAEAGIMVTASHNPKEYNGFKVYTSKGSQIGPPLDREIEESMRALDLTRFDRTGEHGNILRQIKEENNVLRGKGASSSRKRESGNLAGDDISRRNELISSYNEWMFEGWNDNIIQDIRNTSPLVPIVFTGLCGVSGEFVKKALEFYNLDGTVYFIDEECNPNPDFPNLPFPNPEVAETLARSKESNLADIIFSCDPDGDRFGLSERIDGEWVDYNGNEIAAMFMYFFVKNFSPSDLAFVNTYLCNDLMEKVCSAHGIEYLKTETGFKNVSRGVDSVKGKKVFAYEDSLGFLFGNGKEKDGIKCVVLMAYMVQKELPSKILKKMEMYGSFSSVNIHVRCSNPDNVLERALRKLPNVKTEGKRSAVKFDNYKVILRVSGTESMVKVYTSSTALDKKSLAKVANDFIDKYIRSEISQSHN